MVILRLVNFQARIAFLEQVAVLRDSYTAALQDNRIWQATVNAPSNASLACLRNLNSCSAMAGVASPFSPMSADGTLLYNYNPQVPTDGFDVHGNVCRTFNPAASDGRCVIRVDFTWRPSALCTGTCLNPTVQLDARFTFAIPVNSPLAPSPNPARINPAPVFRAGTPNSVLPSTCPARQVVIGFNPDGSALCVPSTAFQACTCASDPCACNKSGQCECPGQCGKTCP